MAHIQQSPTCTRVQITLVYIRYVSNTNSLSVFFKLALWKRFSHRVCCVQIRMYLVNPSVSIPNVVSRHMELSENVLGCRVSSWLLRVSNGTRVVAEDSHGVSAARKDAKLDHELLQPQCSFDASQAAIYSDSIVDWATTDCLTLLQLIAPPFNMKTYPVWDFESSRSEPRLGSTQPFTVSSSSTPP